MVVVVVGNPADVLGVQSGITLCTNMVTGGFWGRSGGWDMAVGWLGGLNLLVSAPASAHGTLIGAYYTRCR